MDYAIVLYFDVQTEQALSSLAQQVAQVTGSRYVVDHVPPHITISALVCDDEAALLERTEILSRELPQGDVPLVALGAFAPLVLYAAPVLNQYLQTACQRANELALQVSQAGNRGRYLPGQWMPHVAMAQKLDHNSLPQAFDCLQKNFKPMLAKAERIALIKWEEHDPYQELAVFDLQKR